MSPLRARLRPAARVARRAVLPIVYRGDAVECPICEGRFRSFVDFRGRPNARCPRCLLLERHRVIWLYLRERTPLWTERVSVLHVAPERPYRDRLKALSNVEYICGDLQPRHHDELRIDVTDLPFDDASFDLVLCNHVLEHVPDDTQAMRELQRVLKRGGRAIMQHPVDYNRPHTFEDPTVTNERDRERLFGQEDHARVYGRDIDERLAAAGLQVRRVDFVGEVGAQTVRRYGLLSRPIHDCIKL